MKMLLITNLTAGEAHNSCDGLFHVAMQAHYETDLARWSRQADQTTKAGNQITLPREVRRRGLWQALRQVVDPDAYDVIVARNLYPVLGQALANRRPGQLVGFWESFPHDYRRVEDAERAGRAVLRQRLTYWWVRKRNLRLLRQAGFFLPNTRCHHEVHYPDLHIPSCPAPQGFDFATFDALIDRRDREGPLRFVYVGALDGLRRMDEVVQAFHEQPGDFVFDLYSKEDGDVAAQIRGLADPRIRYQGGYPRDLLFPLLGDADCGVCYVPMSKVYIAGSPIKAMEYGALGLTFLANPMPDLEGLVDSDCVYFSDFEPADMGAAIQRVLATPRAELRRRGRLCRERIQTQRSFARIAADIAAFLRDLAARHGP